MKNTLKLNLNFFDRIAYISDSKTSVRNETFTEKWQNKGNAEFLLIKAVLS